LIFGLCAAQRRDEIGCYQKSVTPFFAMHSAKSTSFGGFELKRDREEAKKRAFFAKFLKPRRIFLRTVVKRCSRDSSQFRICLDNNRDVTSMTF
jgi:hypothetical protein